MKRIYLDEGLVNVIVFLPEYKCIVLAAMTLETIEIEGWWGWGE